MLFALIDCNNFYVSCERAFNPILEKKPVVVLSNNDGCIISRSNEAKKLKIPMGAPFYQWKSFCQKHRVSVFSSNYELYGDMSARIMQLLKNFNEKMEIYSIDEAFLLFEKKISFLELVNLRAEIIKSTGVPISIGIGQSKTLAKIANYIAKNSTESGVYILENSPHELIHFPVEKIWGIGSKTAMKLNRLNITNALQLRDANPKSIRLHFSVNVEKTIRELNGISCIGLEKQQRRKQIISSRSFGKVVTELSDLEEAVSHYTSRAAQKLRKQHSVASALHVFLQTNVFRENQARHVNGLTFSFVTPTADTRYLIQIAKKCLQRIYKKNYDYHKAGIMLLDIIPEKNKQQDLFLSEDTTKSDQVMRIVDEINASFGKNSIFIAAEGVKRQWLIRCDKRSSRYTTRWNELLTVYCR